MSLEITLNVKCPTQSPKEIVCVIGSTPELGSWNPDRAIQMQNVGKNIWSGNIVINSDAQVFYRYCICIVASGVDIPSKMIVRKWETDIQARQICPKQAERMDNFGQISSVCHVQNGWLTNQKVVSLMLQGPKALDLNLTYKNLLVQVIPIGQTEKCWSMVDVSKLNENDCIFLPQPKFGIEWNSQDFLHFQIQLLDLSQMGCLVQFFASSKLEPELLGFSYIDPLNLLSPEGTIQICIFNSSTHTTKEEGPPDVVGFHQMLSKCQNTIGQLTLKYFVVQPLADADNDLSKTFVSHWIPSWKGLNVGHRGCGNSFTARSDRSTIRENTIGSFNLAAHHGADLVEFDVILSRDIVPIVYHDAEVLLPKDDGSLSKVLVSSLTLDQLKTGRCYHTEEDHTGRIIFEQNSHPDFQPFPTLVEVFRQVDQTVGFNIELKWDVELVDSSHKLKNSFEINLYADTVIKTVMGHSGNRYVVFSSFSPDLCNALRLKQNKFPVIFLTQGQYSRFDKILDPRCQTVPNAIYFASMIDILGINALTFDLLQDPDLIKLAKEKFDKVIFGWTDHRNDLEHINTMKRLGLDAIIYDQLNLKIHNFKKQRVFCQTANRFQNCAKNVNKEELIETVMDSLIHVSSPTSSKVHKADLVQMGDLSPNLSSQEFDTDVNEIADSLANTIRTLGLQKEAEIEATDNQINQLNQSKEKKATTNNLKASLGVQTNQVQTRTWVVQAGKDWHDPDSQESREFEISPELWQELLSTRFRESETDYTQDNFSSDSSSASNSKSGRLSNSTSEKLKLFKPPQFLEQCSFTEDEFLLLVNTSFVAPTNELLQTKQANSKTFSEFDNPATLPLSSGVSSLSNNLSSLEKSTSSSIPSDASSFSIDPRFEIGQEMIASLSDPSSKLDDTTSTLPNFSETNSFTNEDFDFSSDASLEDLEFQLTIDDTQAADVSRVNQPDQLLQIESNRSQNNKVVIDRNGTEHLILKKIETSRVFEIELGHDESKEREILLPFLKIVQNQTQQISKINDGSIEKIHLSRTRFEFVGHTGQSKLKQIEQNIGEAESA